jgi:sulfate transport system ATP-binding protein
LTDVAFGLDVARVRRRLPGRSELSACRPRQAREAIPPQLSGGQRRGGARAWREPQLLLLDEPFGAVDAKVREELRQWLRRLHDEVGVTSIFVTHDQDEAFSVSDRVLVIHQGALEQSGTPTQILDEPATEFVARFVGEVNVFPAIVRDGMAVAGALSAPLVNDRMGPVHLVVRS